MRSSKLTWLSLPLLALACNTESPPTPQEQLGTAEEPAVCPPATTVSGIDIAAYQHPNGAGINWGSVKGSGEHYVIIKATEDTGYTNGYYSGDASGARGAGMVVGAYHFLSPSSQTGHSGAQQAAHFLAAANVQASDMPPMLDVESSQLYNSVLPSAGDILGWLQAVHTATGKKPFIYIGYYTLTAIPNYQSLNGYDIDVPSYGACPNVPAGFNIIMWQDTSTKAVPGIQGSVDHDIYYGSQTQFDAWVNKPPPSYGASFVAQSWPFASTTMTMTVNQVLPATITMKNIGAKPWDSKTKLATTQPRDRPSPFYDAGNWPANNRLDAVVGTVAPGADYKFSFNFKAPNTPGMHDEFYGMVEEGVTWFSDPSEGGPADNVIEAKINVVEADYHGEFVSQTFPTLQQPAITMNVGDDKMGTITMKNVGLKPWDPGTTKLAPIARDKPSALAASTWLSPTRVSSPPATVMPGQSYAFPVTLHASAVGDFTQYFSMVQDGVTWFADAPKGGGPPDNQIAVHVKVGPSTSTSSTGTSMSTSATTGATSTGAAMSTGTSTPTTGTGFGGGAATGSGGGGGSGSGNKKSGCSCTVAGETDGLGTPISLASVALGLMFSLRRRRRTGLRS